MLLYLSCSKISSQSQIYLALSIQNHLSYEVLQSDQPVYLHISLAIQSASITHSSDAVDTLLCTLTMQYRPQT